MLGRSVWPWLAGLLAVVMWVAALSTTEPTEPADPAEPAAAPEPDAAVAVATPSTCALESEVLAIYDPSRGAIPRGSRLARLDLCDFTVEHPVDRVGVTHVAAAGGHIYVDGDYDNEDPSKFTFFQHVDKLVDGKLTRLDFGEGTLWILAGVTPTGSIVVTNSADAVEFDPATGLDRRPIDLTQSREPDRWLISVGQTQDGRLAALIGDNPQRVMELVVEPGSPAEQRVQFADLGMGGRIAQGVGPALGVAIHEQGDRDGVHLRTVIVDPVSLDRLAELPGWSALTWAPDGETLVLARVSDNALGIVTADDWSNVEVLGNPGLGRIWSMVFPG